MKQIARLPKNRYAYVSYNVFSSAVENFTLYKYKWKSPIIKRMSIKVENPDEFNGMNTKNNIENK